MAQYNFIIDTGTIQVDTASLLSDVQSEFQAALGSGINLAASTPQGTLMQAESIARAFVMQNNSALANMINPNLSEGTFLDALCAFTGTQRGVNIPTAVSGVSFVNQSLTQSITIPAGARVSDGSGNIWTVFAALTIAANTTVTGILNAQNPGPVSMTIPVSPNPPINLTIIDGVVGWGLCQVPNTASQILGTLSLTDAQLKIARMQQLAIQGVGSSLAIASQLAAVPNVTSYNIVENNTGTVTTVNGITFTLPNAMWVCVAGTATSAAIAQALYAAHPGGGAWDYGGSGMGTPVSSPNGVQVTDPATGLPYYVKYTSPIALTGYVYIQVHNLYSTAAYQAVQNAIMNYATGQEAGEPGLTIGASFSAYEIAGAVNRQLPGIYVKVCAVYVGASAPPAYPNVAWLQEVVAQPYQQIQLQIGNIQVVVV
jgi:hypothetical protein